MRPVIWVRDLESVFEPLCSDGGGVIDVRARRETSRAAGAADVLTLADTLSIPGDLAAIGIEVTDRTDAGLAAWTHRGPFDADVMTCRCAAAAAAVATTRGARADRDR